MLTCTENTAILNGTRHVNWNHPLKSEEMDIWVVRTPHHQFRRSRREKSSEAPRGEPVSEKCFAFCVIYCIIAVAFFRSRSYIDI